MLYIVGHELPLVLVEVVEDIVKQELVLESAVSTAQNTAILKLKRKGSIK